MGWQDRGYAGNGARTPGGRLRRIFGDGENPMGWALPLYRAWGIEVKAHWFLLLFIAIELLTSINRDVIGLGYAALLMFSLFFLVLLHEYGHCFACRKVGGDADEIVLWPLGGLAYCRPPERWRAHLWTVIGGPAVNAVLLVPLAGLLLLITGEIRSAAFNPFEPGSAILFATLSDGSQPMWLRLLWSLHYINLILLAFNVLLPMYPMDGGRILHALIWRSKGRREADRISATVGLAVAMGVGVLAIALNEITLIAIALFGGLTCWGMKKQMEFERTAGEPWQTQPAWDDEPPASARSREPEIDQAEIDRILAKISKEGMGALTRREKKTLRSASGDRTPGRGSPKNR